MPLIRMLVIKGNIPYDEVDDLVQEVFISYFTTYPPTKPEIEIKRILARITKNRIIDFKRKQKRHPEVCYDPVLLQNDIFMADALFEPDSLSILLAKQEYQEIAHVLLSMKKEWLEIFVLHTIEGRPMAEISRMTGVSESACRMRLHRGREYLRECMREKDELKEDRKSAVSRVDSSRISGYKSNS